MYQFVEFFIIFYADVLREVIDNHFPIFIQSSVFTFLDNLFIHIVSYYRQIRTSSLVNINLIKYGTRYYPVNISSCFGWLFVFILVETLIVFTSI